MSIIGFTTLLISPDRIQYIRKIRAKVRFGGMFIFLVGGIGFFNTDIDHQPIPGNMSIFYISSMVDQPSTTQKNDNHKKSKTTKDVPFKKGHLPKKITPPPPRSFSIFRDVWLFTAMSWSNASFLLKAICNSVSMSFFWPAKTCRASPDQNIKTYELIMGIKLLDSKNHNLLPEQLDRSTDFGLLCFTYT